MNFYQQDNARKKREFETNIAKAMEIINEEHDVMDADGILHPKTGKTTWAISIMRDQRRPNGWIKLYVRTDCRRFSAEAKVYDLPDGTDSDYMGYGVREGSRVSKLGIRDVDHYPPLEVYNWDRGLDFDEAPEGLVDAIVNYCDALPLVNWSDDPHGFLLDVLFS